MTAAATSPAKAEKKTPSKKPASKPTHPPTSEMVNAALAALKEDRKGSSLQAIKKYIAGNYQLDIERQAPFIKKYLKAAVENKTIIQTKGVGASGSFKLAAKTKVEGEKKPKTKKSADKTVTKSPASKAKKSADKTVTKAENPKAAKSPSKTKKSGKAPTTVAKPKSPKSKKSAASKAKAVKK